MRVMKTQTVMMLMSKTGRARRRWARKTTEEMKMPSQRASVAQVILTV